MDRIRIALLGALLFAVVGAVGCAESGGGSSANGSGSGSGSSPATPSSAPIDLEPGQTSVRLQWSPSRGHVDGYIVFESRNGGAYAQADFVRAPQYVLSGSPGDRVQVFAIARSVNGSQSSASPASPPIRFHGTAGTSSVASAVVRSTSSSTVPAGVATSSDDSPGSAASNEPGTGETTAADDGSSEAEPSGPAPLDPELRRRLLGADARFPIGDHEPNARAWIQGFVDEQVAAGVELVGTGERDGDGRRDLVWSDPNGQLFVSDGAALESTDDVPSTLVEAIRLNSTERFVALADFDGDGRGEWLIEDAATGAVWIANGSNQPDFTAVTGQAPGDRVLGGGDFDGDGREDILWRHADLSLALGQTDSALSEPASFASSTPGSEAPAIDASDLLGIADLDGDGRDDLLFLDSDGRLHLGMAGSSSEGVVFVLQPGPGGDVRGLELLATLDFDEDGAADVAWWSEAGIQLWALYDAP